MFATHQEMAYTTQLAAIVLTDFIYHGNPAENHFPVDQLISKNRLIQKSLVKKYKGKWLKDLSNGSLTCFVNTLDAVNCAKMFRENLHHEADLGLRINIHLGEVLFKDNEVIGEGIDIRSKVMPREDAEGIFISEAIFNAIKHNQKAGITDIPDPQAVMINRDHSDSRGERENVMTAELSMNEVFIKHLTETVEANLDNEQFSVTDLAAEMALSRSQIHRKLQNLTGQSISQFMRSIRLEKARDLLRKDVATVSEIAYRVGFNSPSYFIKCFHEYYGYPPGEVKKREVNNGNQIDMIEADFLGEKLIKEENELVKLFQIRDDWDNGIAFQRLAVIMLTGTEQTGESIQEMQVSPGYSGSINEVQLKLIEKYNGKIINENENQLSSCFNNTLEAVYCALEIQKQLISQGFANLRIGIHLGDIRFHAGNVSGDGFNTALKLLVLAGPRSILLSEKVYDEIGGEPQIHTRFIGTFNLKEVQRPLGIFAVSDETLSVPEQSSIIQKLKPSGLEDLQPARTQFLIIHVFKEMAIHKPSLEKYLIVEEYENDEDIDIRLLAHQIIKNLPWPVGVELRRLFSGSLRQMNEERLRQLSKTIERTLQLITYILVIELLEQKFRMDFPLDEEFCCQFKQRFGILNPEDLVWLIKKMHSQIEKQGLDFFIPEMQKLLDQEFYDDLESWAEDWDEINQILPELKPAEIASQCTDYEERLTKILKHTAFLVKYKLVNVGTIKVLKRKHSEARFEHSIDILNSSDADFKTREEVLEHFSDSNAVLLMKDLKDPHSFLNLSPLVIDTHSEKLNQGNAFHLKKDIYLYRKFDGEKLYHVGTEVTEELNLAALNNYQNLVNEYKEITQIFSNGN